MYNSIAWPDMFNSNTTNIIQDKNAAKSNLFLLLNSEMRSLFGDPGFGVDNLTSIYFMQNDSNILRDLVIDKIFTAIRVFMPQLFVDRKDITVFSSGTELYADVHVTYKWDNTSDLYTLQLTNTNR